jgi:hypothetical protein
MIDSYFLASQYSTAPLDLASIWLHGVFLPDTPDSSHIILSAFSLARRWLLEKIHTLTDIPLRVRNVIGRELAHRARWTASTTRIPRPAMPQQHDRNPLPAELSNGHQEVRPDIPNPCVAVGLLFQLASRQRELPSGGPTPPNAATIPNLTTKLKQQEIQIVRAVHIPRNIRPPRENQLPHVHASLRPRRRSLATCPPSRSTRFGTHPQLERLHLHPYTPRGRPPVTCPTSIPARRRPPTHARARPSRERPPLLLGEYPPPLQ